MPVLRAAPSFPASSSRRPLPFASSDPPTDPEQKPGRVKIPESDQEAAHKSLRGVGTLPTPSTTVLSLSKVPGNEFAAPFATECMSLWWILAQFIPSWIYDGESQSREQLVNEESALETVCRISCSARLVLFFGGMAQFRSPRLQAVYDFCFVGSFVTCMISCIINYATVQTPPFYDHGTDLLTAYFHVIGLHAWLFWRGFARHKQTQELFSSFFAENTDSFLARGTPALKAHIRLVFRVLLVLQFFLSCVGVGAFPIPAHIAWKEGVHTTVFSEHYTFAHAVIMYTVIPQHIPTMLATIALYFIVSKLHMWDMERVKDLVADTMVNLLGDDTSCGAEVLSTDEAEGMTHLACDLIEAAQLRLRYSCTRFQWLWLHSLMYTFFELFMCMTHLRAFQDSGEELTRDGILLFFTDFFHLGFGVIGLFAALVTPALVTQMYTDCPACVVMSLRKRGVSTTMVGAAFPYLASTAKGFTVLGEPVSTGTVVKFCTMIGIFSSIYLSAGN